MTAPVVIGGAELWLGDCRDFIDRIEANVVCTDVPYGVAGAGSLAGAVAVLSGDRRRDGGSVGRICFVLPPRRRMMKGGDDGE